MPTRVTTDAATSAFRAIVREEAESAAKGNALISKTEEKVLPAYLQARSQHLRQQGGQGTRITVDALVSAAAEHAQDIWSKFNPPVGRDGKTLSRAEVQAIAKADPGLGELTFKAYERVRVGDVVGPKPFAPVPITDAALTTTHPNARLERIGDSFVVTSDTSGRVDDYANRHRGTLAFAGKTIPLDANAEGLIAAYLLSGSIPEGFSFENGDAHRQGDVLRSSFRLFADPPGTLTSDAARAHARAGLVDYIHNTRMHDPDWQTCGLPTTWPALVAAGIETQCASFGDFPADSGQLERRKESYVFAGRGPLGLYTEVEVSKIDGSIKRSYVEID